MFIALCSRAFLVLQIWPNPKDVLFSHLFNFTLTDSRYTSHLVVFKGTPLMYCCVTQLKRFFLRTGFFLLTTCLGHSSLYWGTSICILYDGKSFKTGIIPVDLIKSLVTLFLFNRYISILNRVTKSIEDILKYHTNSFNVLVTRKYFIFELCY